MQITCNIFVNDEPLANLQSLALSPQTTSNDLQLLINDQLENSDQELIYEFYINSEPITSSLLPLITSTEQVIQITAVPQSSHKVAPLSRCSNDLPGHTDAVLTLQFSPNSQFLASGSGDKTVRIWDTNSCCPVKILELNAWILAVKFSPSGKFLVTADYEGAITIFETQNWTKIGGFGIKNKQKSWITSIVWTTDSEHFFTGSKDGSVKKWNTKCDLVKVVFTSQKCITDITVGGKTLIFSSEDCKVYIFDLVSLGLIQVIRHAHWCNSVQTSLWYLCRFGVQGLIKLFQVYKLDIMKINDKIHNQRLFEELSEDEQQKIYTQLLHSKKEVLVTTSDDHTLTLHQLSPEVKFIAKLTGHVKPVSQACFSPDGTVLVSVSFDRSVRLWSCEGKFLAKFHNHVSEVYRVSFSADSRYFITCSKDSTCMLYSVKKRKMIRQLPGHFDEVYCVDWSLLGEIGASAGKDRIVKIWRQ